MVLSSKKSRIGTSYGRLFMIIFHVVVLCYLTFSMKLTNVVYHSVPQLIVPLKFTFKKKEKIDFQLDQ